MTWLEDTTGVNERSPEQVRRELSTDQDSIVCSNGKRMAFGRLETPKPTDLRSAVARSEAFQGRRHAKELRRRNVLEVCDCFLCLACSHCSPQPEWAFRTWYGFRVGDTAVVGPTAEVIEDRRRRAVARFDRIGDVPDGAIGH